MVVLLKAGSFLCLVVVLLCCLLGSCTEFEVEGKDGWVVPKSKDHYNHWASNNRFVVGDTLRFKYEKDSVMVVSEEEYGKCKTSHPVFFSNNGDTVFKFDRAGLFFFISGVSGHCNRGQKMIIKVLDVDAHSPQSHNQNATQSSDVTAGAAQTTAPVSKTTSALFVVSAFLGLLFA